MINDGLEKAVLSLCAGKFMAGETLGEMIDFARKANQDGTGVLINYLGENVTSSRMAEENRNVYFAVIEAIKENNLKARPSLKMTQLGLKIDDSELCYNLTKEIVAFAGENNILVEIDMEDSTCVEKTIYIVLKLCEEGFSNIRLVLQAYLFRTPADFEKLSAAGAKIRFCKGAYDESPEIAIKDEKIIKWVLKSLFHKALVHGENPALATHDLEVLNLVVKGYKHPWEDRFEIQLLFGIRRHYRKKLVKQGFDCWIYAPFGNRQTGFAYMKRRWAYILKNLPSFCADEALYLISLIRNVF